MTLEAAFLIPMVLCVIVIMIYTAFYLYDRCLLNQNAYLVCFREGMTKEGAVRTASGKSGVGENKKQIPGRYFAVTAIQTEDESTKDSVALGGTAKVTPAVFGGSSLMPQSIWTIRFRGMASRFDPPEKIRRFRRTIHVSGRVLDLFQK